MYHFWDHSNKSLTKQFTQLHFPPFPALFTQIHSLFPPDTPPPVPPLCGERTPTTTTMLFYTPSVVSAAAASAVPHLCCTTCSVGRRSTPHFSSAPSAGWWQLRTTAVPCWRPLAVPIPRCRCMARCGSSWHAGFRDGPGP